MTISPQKPIMAHMELLTRYLESSIFLFPLLMAIFGLVVGSFLNVIIYRLPIMIFSENHSIKKKVFNLFLPPSHCTYCKKLIKWFDNIPFFSFIFLRGKCRKCKKKISWHYPTVELLSACTAAFAAYSLGFNWQALAASIFGFSLISLVFIDLKHQLLPDQITLSLLWFGLLLSALGFFVTPENSIIGAAVGYISLWAIAKIFQVLRGIPGMGHGDFKLFAALGAWLGWQILPMTLLIASLTALICGVILIALKKHSFHKPLPFGPYLALAGWISFFWGQEIFNWYWPKLFLQ